MWREPATATGPGRATRTRRWFARPGVWLPVLAFLVYNANFGYGACGADDFVFRYMPTAILRHGALTLDPIRDVVTTETGLKYSVMSRGGHLVPVFPPATAILALPVWAIPSFLWEDLPTFLLGKITASAMAALSVGFVYASVKRLGVSERWAIGLGTVYAFATPVHANASRALCQHPAATLATAACVYTTIRASGSSGRWSAAAGLSAGVAIAVRPQTAVIVVPLLVHHVLSSGRRENVGMLAGASVALFPALAYNLLVVGHLVGGYGAIHGVANQRFDGAVVGVLGLLVSPNRGLLFFAPAALLGFWGGVRALRERRWYFAGLITGAVLTVLLFGSFGHWWGGHTYGPRFLTEAMPVLVVLLVPVVRNQDSLRRGLVTVLIVVSAGVGVVSQTVGAMSYPCGWNMNPRSVDGDPSRIWSLSDSQILRCASKRPSLDPSGLLRATHRLGAG